MSMYIGIIVVLSITALAVLACAVLTWVISGNGPAGPKDGEQN